MYLVGPKSLRLSPLKHVKTISVVSSKIYTNPISSPPPDLVSSDQVRDIVWAPRQTVQSAALHITGAILNFRAPSYKFSFAPSLIVKTKDRSSARENTTALLDHAQLDVQRIRRSSVSRPVALQNYHFFPRRFINSGYKLAARRFPRRCARSWKTSFSSVLGPVAAALLAACSPISPGIAGAGRKPSLVGQECLLPHRPPLLRRARFLCPLEISVFEKNPPAVVAPPA